MKGVLGAECWVLRNGFHPVFRGSRLTDKTNTEIHHTATPVMRAMSLFSQHSARRADSFPTCRPFAGSAPERRIPPQLQPPFAVSAACTQH